MLYVTVNGISGRVPKWTFHVEATYEFSEMSLPTIPLRDGDE